jgi:hypothetical protein
MRRASSQKRLNEHKRAMLLWRLEYCITIDALNRNNNRSKTVCGVVRYKYTLLAHALVMSGTQSWELNHVSISMRSYVEENIFLVDGDLPPFLVERQGQPCRSSSISSPSVSTYCSSSLAVSIPQCRRRDLQIKEGKLTGRASVLVHKATGKIAAEDSSQVIIGNLGNRSQHLLDPKRNQTSSPSP